MSPPRLVLASRSPSADRPEPTLDLDAAEAAAQRLAFLGASGSGKSYGCGRLVEQLSAAHVPVIVLDTVGIWPSIRLAKDGKSPGLPFVVMGGDHADLPLELGSAGMLARFLVTQNASVVLDVSDYAPDERAPFVADLCERLLIECKQQTRRRPRVVVYDEAQDLAPEKPAKGEDRMLKAVSALIRKGRNHLVGTVLLTQRPADVSKTALNLCGTLIVGAMFAKHDRLAVRDWAGAKARSLAVEAQLKELPELPPGDFFLWSPQWLRRYERITILPKWTFDGSSSTPLPGDAALGKVAPVDVGALRALLAPPVAPAPLPTADATAARATARSGKGANGTATPATDSELGLRHSARVVELEGRVRDLEAECQVLREQRAELVERGQAPLALAIAVEQAMEVYRESKRVDVRQDYRAGMQRMEALPVVHPETFEVRGPGIDPNGVVESEAARKERRRAASAPDRKGGASADYRQVLVDTLVRYGDMSRDRLSLLSGKSKTSSTFDGALSQVISEGLVVSKGGQLGATAEGRKRARGTPLPMGEALYHHYLARLSPYDRKTLQAVAPVPDGLTRIELAKRSGHSPTSSTFDESLSRLKRYGLCESHDGRFRMLPSVRQDMGMQP